MAFVLPAQTFARAERLQARVTQPSTLALHALAHVVNSSRWGGMEARTLETAQWQRAAGLDVVIVTPPDGALFREAQARGVPVEGIDFAGGGVLPNLQRMRRVFRRRGVQLADVHTNRSLALGVRDMATLVRTQHILRQPRPGQRTLNKEFPFDGFILSSQGGRDALLALGYARDSRVCVVGEWAEERFFDPAPSPAMVRLTKRRLGLPAEGLVIGAVAMLRPDNAFDSLIRATAALKARGVVVDCLVVGGPMIASPDPCPQERALRALAAELDVADRVHVLGHRDDVAEVLGVMDVACLVSRHTAQTRVAPEAAARGRPVVGFDVGALRETVRHGWTGLLTPPGDEAAFTAALADLLASPQRRAAMGAEASRHARDHFRQSDKMQETLDGYRQAMARRRGLVALPAQGVRRAAALPQAA